MCSKGGFLSCFRKKILLRVASLKALFLKATEPVKGGKLNTEPIALGPSLVGSLVIEIYTMTELSYPSADSFPKC